MKRNSLIKIAALAISLLVPAFALAQNTPCGEKDYSCQLRVLMEDLKKNPKNIETYYNIGVVYQKSGFHKEAVEAFSMYLVVGVSDARHMADGYNNRGISYRNLGKYDLAIQDYTKAIGLVPADASLFVNRGNVYRDMKEHDKATAEYTRAIWINAKHAPAYVARGHIYMLKGDPDGAMADFNKAIENDPNESEAYYNRATVNFGKKEFVKAIPDYDKYIALDHASPAGLADGHLNRGICYAVGGNLDKALEDFTRAVVLNPKLTNAYKARAYVYRETKKIELAEADEKKAAELAVK